MLPSLRQVGSPSLEALLRNLLQWDLYGDMAGKLGGLIGVHEFKWNLICCCWITLVYSGFIEGKSSSNGDVIVI